MAPAGYDSYRDRDRDRYSASDTWSPRSPPRGPSNYSSRSASRRDSRDYGSRSPRGDTSKDSSSPRHIISPLGNQGTASRAPAPMRWATKELHSEKTITPIEKSAPKLIQATLVEVFAQIGNDIVDVALLKHKRNAAKLESEKRSSEYQKNKDNHQKYPSVEESQRKARDVSEKTFEFSSKALEKKTTALNESFSANAAKLWSTLVTVVEKASVQKESSTQYKELEEQIKAQKHKIDQQASNYEKLEGQLVRLQKQFELQQQSTAKGTDVIELKQRQETLDGRITEHSAKLTQVNQSLSNLEQTVGLLEVKVGHASTFVNDLESRVTTLDSVTKQINGNLERVEDNSKGLSATFDTHKAEYDKLVVLVHASVNKLSDQDILKEKVETLGTQVYEIEKSIDHIRNLPPSPSANPELVAKVGRLEQQLSDFGQRLTSIGASIESGTALAKVENALSTRLVVVESAIELGTKESPQHNHLGLNDLEKRFEESEREIRGLIEEMNRAADELAGATEERIASLTLQLKALQPQADQLNQALSTRVNLLEQKSNSLEQKSNSLEQKSNSLEQKSNSLEQKSNSLEQKSNSLEQRSNTLEHNSNSLDVTISQHNTILTNISSQCIAQDLEVRQRLEKTNLHCEANGVAITGLDNRFNNLTTSELYQAMSALATTNYDTKLRGLEEEHKLLKSRINNLGTVLSTDCITRTTMLGDKIRAELDEKHAYLSERFRDMNNDFSKLLEREAKQGGVSGLKRTVTNGYTASPNGRHHKRQRTVSDTNSDGDTEPNTRRAAVSHN